MRSAETQQRADGVFGIAGALGMLALLAGAAAAMGRRRGNRAVRAELSAAGALPPAQSANEQVQCKLEEMASERDRVLAAIASVQAADRTEAAGEAEPAVEATLDVEDEYLLVLSAEVGPERAGKCVNAFLADTAVHISGMDRLLGEAKWNELGRLARGLAGISGTLGAISLADGLLMLEDAAQAEAAERAGSALRDVQATWERTRVALRARRARLCAERNGAPRRAA